jgi:HSP20 family molecular chaperone IbpA
MKRSEEAMSDITKVQDKNSQTPTTRAYRGRLAAPAVDVFENADGLLIVADVPGVRGDGIELRIENDTLTLEAKRLAENDRWPALAREYEEVDYVATFRIPAGIDAAAITAETKNGTLSVRLPKAAAAKPRKIAVQSVG